MEDQGHHGVLRDNGRDRQRPAWAEEAGSRQGQRLAETHHNNNLFVDGAAQVIGRRGAPSQERPHPSRSFGSNDPRRMELSEDDRQKALRFRNAMATRPDLDPISDFWCAQYALTLGDDIEEFLDRALQLQYYREEYGIVDTVDFGLQCIRELMDLCPGYFLAYCFIPDGSYVLIVDQAKFDAQAIRQSRIVYFKASYFVSSLFFVDLESIRKGSVLMYECDGYDWKQNLRLSDFRKVGLDLVSIYPHHIQQVKFFNTGVLANLVTSMSKQFLPPHIREKFHMGCQFEMGRLDNIYNLPSFEAAQERLWNRIELGLRQRYRNIESFSLDSSSE